MSVKRQRDAAFRLMNRENSTVTVYQTLHSKPWDVPSFCFRFRRQNTSPSRHTGWMKSWLTCKWNRFRINAVHYSALNFSRLQFGILIFESFRDVFQSDSSTASFALLRCCNNDAPSQACLFRGMENACLLSSSPPNRLWSSHSIRCRLPLQVRYLREVTPYFRKSLTTPTSSPVMLPSGNGSGSGGDLSHGMGVSAAGVTSSGGSGLPQTGLWPLRLCYLCRNLTVVDPSERCFEVHSPDGRRSCVLRCQDRERALAWFTAVSQQIAVLNQTCLQELNRLLPANQELKYLGWLCEQVSTRMCWCSVRIDESSRLHFVQNKKCVKMYLMDTLEATNLGFIF